MLKDCYRSFLGSKNNIAMQVIFSVQPFHLMYALTESNTVLPVRFLGDQWRMSVPKGHFFEEPPSQMNSANSFSNCEPLFRIVSEIRTSILGKEIAPAVHV